jgi:hypothetical protein
MCPESDLWHIVRDYEEKYYSGVTQIAEIEFVTNLDGPAKLLIPEKKIQINSNMMPYPVLCSFLVLHELINHKIVETNNGQHPGYESPEFQGELERLWGLGAYKDLL